MLQFLDSPTAGAPLLNRTCGYSRKCARMSELMYPIAKCSYPLALREGETVLFWLDDVQWRAIALLLPSRQTGPKRSDDRTIISGIVHVLLSGCAWRDCPVAYGPSMTVFNRFNRWKHRGLWSKISAVLTDPKFSTLTPKQRETLQAAQSARAQASVARQRKDAADLSVHQAWEDAAMQLRRIAEVNRGRPLEEWVDAVVEWHMDAVFAHLDRNTPDAGAAAAKFDAQFAALRSDLLSAVTSLRAYVNDPRHNAAPVRQQLARLEFGLKQATLTGSRRAS